jgi:hypothetical protein
MDLVQHRARHIAGPEPRQQVDQARRARESRLAPPWKSSISLTSWSWSIRSRVKGDLPIVFTDDKLSAYGGIELFRRFVDRSGFCERLEKRRFRSVRSMATTDRSASRWR